MGAVVSGGAYTIITVKLAVPMFPAASDAVHVTAVVPTGNTVPGGEEHVGPLVTPTSSVAVTSNVIVVPEDTEDVADTSAGTVTVGAVTSVNVTVIVNVASPVFPSVSVAEHVTVVVPTGNNEPDAGVHVGPLAMPMLSVAVAPG